MKYLLYTSLLTTLLLSACTEPIELDLNTDENVRLVLDGLLTTDTTAHLIDLTLTTDYFKEGIPDRAEGAMVTISDGNTIETLTELEPGKYYTSENYAGVENTSYTLEIDYQNKIYSSTSILPKVTTLDSVFVVPYEPVIFGEEEEQEGPADNYAVIPYFQEPSTLGDYYIFKMLINDEYFTGGIIDWFFTDDQIVNGSYIGDTEFFTFYAEPGDVITFEQFSVTKEVFENLNAILLETIFRGGLFDGAPANIPANIDNGAVGVFIASDVERKSVTIE